MNSCLFLNHFFQCYDGDLESAPVLFIIGNKNDLSKERKVKFDDGQLVNIPVTTR